MARVGGRDTSAEKLLRHHLWNRGQRYCVNARTPAGCGDIVFKTGRLAVFVDGSFGTAVLSTMSRPRSPTEFWSEACGQCLQGLRTDVVLQGVGVDGVPAVGARVFENPHAAAERVARTLTGEGATLRRAWRVMEAHAVEGTTHLERWLLVDLHRPQRRRTIMRRRSTRKWRVQA